MGGTHLDEKLQFPVVQEMDLASPPLRHLREGGDSNMLLETGSTGQDSRQIHSAANTDFQFTFVAGRQNTDHHKFKMAQTQHIHIAGLII